MGSKNQDSRYDFPETPDKNERRIGLGNCCPPTSEFSNFRKLRLQSRIRTSFIKLFLNCVGLASLSYQNHMCLIMLNLTKVDPVPLKKHFETKTFDC